MGEYFNQRDVYAIAKWIGLYRMKRGIISRNVSIYLITVGWAICVVVLGIAGDLVIDSEPSLGLVDCCDCFSVIPKLNQILLFCNWVKVINAENSCSVVASLY